MIPKPLTLPRGHGSRPDEHQGVAPAAPEARYPTPEYTVAWVNAWPPGRSPIDRQLMSQCDDLDLQGQARAEQDG